MATVQSNMFEQIQQELSCSICLELFTRPKVLPCQHTFCQDCLKDHARRGGTFQCPNCRQEINLPQKGVASFPTNNLVANLCDTLRKRDKEKDKNQPKVKCPQHRSKDVNLYCNWCQVPVCVKCLGENHKGHSATSVKTAAQEKTASVVKLIAKAQNIMDTYFNCLLDMLIKETILNEQKQKIDVELETALANAVQHLMETKASLQSQADQEYIKNIKDLQTQKAVENKVGLGG
ncbi:hypothetical protein Bbelb_164470 [Branchiostoma belcheri]|nr:hypothetical protein Bbelb_164470 [Branchiostoma belcheri]